jgi:hypothetical protein
VRKTRQKNKLDNSRANSVHCALDMKNSPLTSILLGALVVSVLASVGLCWTYMSRERERRVLVGQMQNEVVAIQRNRAFITSLAGELMEYSKTHKDIEPILEAAGLTQGKSASAPASAPATNRSSGK